MDRLSHQETIMPDGRSLADHRLRVLHKLVAVPVGVIGKARLGLLRSDGLLLHAHQLRVRRHVRQRQAPELLHAVEAVLHHKALQLRAQSLHQRVAVHHDAGADLHGVGAKEDELGGVGAVLHAADAGERALRVLRLEHLGDGHHARQRNWLDRLARVAARRGVALHRRHWPQSLEIDAHHALDGVDGGDAVAAVGHRGARGGGDVGHVGRHLGPHRDGGSLVDPAANLAEQLAVLPHGHAHLALRHPVWAGEVDLKGIHAHLFAPANELLPCALVVLLHDGGNEHSVGVLLLEALELVQHDLQRAVADELDVLPAEHLVVGALELGVARRDVDDLGRVQADRLGNHAAPALVERLLHYDVVRTGRAAADDEGVGHFQAVDLDGQAGPAGYCAVLELEASGAIAVAVVGGVAHSQSATAGSPRLGATRPPRGPQPSA
mmetsp:Transcript_42699/g.107991  ORF Transcript_42699/g.107991 Transcript_42699/m.107991 type:complete len:437 (+) Transcript_42699:397-1707(+)